MTCGQNHRNDDGDGGVFAGETIVFLIVNSQRRRADGLLTELG